MSLAQSTLHQHKIPQWQSDFCWQRPRLALGEEKINFFCRVLLLPHLGSALPSLKVGLGNGQGEQLVEGEVGKESCYGPEEKEGIGGISVPRRKEVVLVWDLLAVLPAPTG